MCDLQAALRLLTLTALGCRIRKAHADSTVDTDGTHHAASVMDGTHPDAPRMTLPVGAKRAPLVSRYLYGPLEPMDFGRLMAIQLDCTFARSIHVSSSARRRAYWLRRRRSVALAILASAPDAQRSALRSVRRESEFGVLRQWAALMLAERDLE